MINVSVCTILFCNNQKLQLNLHQLHNACYYTSLTLLHLHLNKTLVISYLFSAISFPTFLKWLQVYSYSTTFYVHDKHPERPLQCWQMHSSRWWITMPFITMPGHPHQESYLNAVRLSTHARNFNLIEIYNHRLQKT